MKLEMRTSRLTIIDSLNTDIRKSAYFDYPLTLKIISYIYCYHKQIRNEPIEQLSVWQQKIQRQDSPDCGPISLLNCELLIKNQNPAELKYDNVVMAHIRKYHFLLHESSIEDLRLTL